MGEKGILASSKIRRGSCPPALPTPPPLPLPTPMAPLGKRVDTSNTLDYTDLHGFQLYVKLHVTKSDGTSLDGSTEVGRVNLFLQ